MGIDNLKRDNKRKVIISVLKVLLLIGIVAGIPLYIYFCQGDWLKQFEGFDDVVAYLQHYKWESVPIHIRSSGPADHHKRHTGAGVSICSRVPVFVFPCAVFFNLRSIFRHHHLFLPCKDPGKRLCTSVFWQRKDPRICAEAQFQTGLYDRVYIISDTGTSKRCGQLCRRRFRNEVQAVYPAVPDRTPSGDDGEHHDRKHVE